MTPKQAMELIIQHASNPALNYAVKYAEYGICILNENTNEFKVQCLYILNNISG